MKSKTTSFVLAVCSVGVLGILQPAISDEYMLREAAQYVQDRDGAPIPHVATSEHFAMKWGDGNDKNYKMDEAWQKGALNWFEHVRGVYKDKVGLPYIKSEKDKYKINIYVSETNLKPFLHGYAFGFPDTEGYGVFDAEPSCMAWGNFASAHELGHAAEGETGNFRDSEYVGWFWECCAQFMAQQVEPGKNLPEMLDLFCDMCNFDWNTASNWHQYSGWIFMQYLKEKKGYGYPFFDRVWLEKSAYLDEDPVNKMIRLKGLTRDEWADLYGDFAKRNVNFATYEHGKAYKECLTKGRHRTLSHWKLGLEEISDKPGWYKIPYAAAPHQNAYNIIPLFPTAKKVTVDLKGLVDEYRQSDWRATLVVVNDKGGERYSNTIKKFGSASVTLKPNEYELYLVVAATPHIYNPIQFLQDYRTQDRFPYEVRIDGADPKGKVVDLLPYGVTGAPHCEGGGFVAATAKVAASAYVGPNARVLGNAQVKDLARIEDYAVISGDAVVSENAVISGHASVSGKAVVSGNARVRDYAEISGTKTTVEGNARILEYARVNGAHVYENAVLRGFCGMDGNIHGTAMFTGAACSDSGGIKDCTKGIYSLYTSQEHCEKGFDMDGLYANYDFNKPNNLLLRDSVATADGFIYGKPEWVADSGKGKALSFNGLDQYVELPKSVFDLRDCQIDVAVKWAGGGAGQKVFDFGRDKGNCMYFTPKNDEGKAAFVVMRDGGPLLVASGTIPQDKWCSISIIMKDGYPTVTVDGAKFVTHQGYKFEATTKPERVTGFNYLARGQEGGFFKGEIDNLRVYIRDKY